MTKRSIVEDRIPAKIWFDVLRERKRQRECAARWVGKFLWAVLSAFLLVSLIVAALIATKEWRHPKVVEKVIHYCPEGNYFSKFDPDCNDAAP